MMVIHEWAQRTMLIGTTMGAVRWGFCFASVIERNEHEQVHGMQKIGACVGCLHAAFERYRTRFVSTAITIVQSYLVRGVAAECYACKDCHIEPVLSSVP